MTPICQEIDYSEQDPPCLSHLLCVFSFLVWSKYYSRICGPSMVGLNAFQWFPGMFVSCPRMREVLD